MEKERLGFIGVGDMGRHMARRLLEAGYPLTIYDVRAEAMEPLVAKGATAAGSPKEVASAAEIVLVSLPTPDVVETVATGTDGIIGGSKVKTYVDLSTTGAVTAKRVAAKLAEKGIATLDCPVSGGSRGADKGTLALMASGARDLYESLLPVLKVIGKNPFFIGEQPGLGQTMKLANNYLSASNNAATAEAMVMGVKAGIDPATMLDVINASSGRNTATEDKFPTFVLERTFHGGFTLKLLHKDVKLCMEEAEALGVPMWVGNAVRQLLAQTLAEGRGTESSTSLVKTVEGWAGVEVGGAARKAADAAE